MPKFSEPSKRSIPTDQQKKILKGYFLGKSYKQIADELCIAETTVGCYVNSLKEEWHFNNRTQMIWCAYVLGHVEDEWIEELYQDDTIFPDNIRKEIKDMLLTLNGTIKR